MLESVIESFENYYNELPSNTFYCVGRSALFSFTASILLSKSNIPAIFSASLADFRHPLQAAAYASLAALIHALATPLFNKIFADNDQNQLHREFLKTVFDVSVTRLFLLCTGLNNDDVPHPLSIISSNLFISIAHIFDGILNQIDPQSAREVAYYMDYWGLTTPSDSGSTFLVV